MKVSFLYCAAAFGSSLLLTVASGYPVQAAPSKAEIDNYAKANGFPNSDYPYYERTNRCGGKGWSGTAIRDSWGKVSFGDACDNHDRCYMTLGSDLNACDDNFYKDVRASCERDSYVRVFRKKVRDPVTLSACYSIATSYYSAVRAFGSKWYKDAQKQAKKYNDVVQALSQRPV